MASYDHEDLKSTEYKRGYIDNTGYDRNFSIIDTEIKRNKIKYKYNEDKSLEEIKKYIDNTYSQHYQSEDGSDLQCLDVWFALGSVITSCRDVVMKYLWRVGKKGNKEEFRKDVIKAIHYCFFILYALDYQKNN